MAFQDKRNNPGNLKFANQPGAIGADEKGFAIFPDKETGMEAMRRQLELDLVKREKTGREFIYKYAPPSDNNPTDAYVQNVFGELGIDPDKKVDPNRLSDIQRLMVRQEHGREGMEHYYSNTNKSPAGTTPNAKPSASFNVVAAAVPALAASAILGNRPSQTDSSYTSDDIGTLGQYQTRKFPMYSSALSKKFKRAIAKNVKTKPKTSALSENTVRFKDLRKKIYEQIIQNEESEKGDL